MKTNPSLSAQFAALTRQEPTTWQQDVHDMGSQGLANFILANKDRIRFVEDTPDQGRLTAEQVLMKQSFFTCVSNDTLESLARLMREYAAQFEGKWKPISEGQRNGELLLVGGWSKKIWKQKFAYWNGIRMVWIGFDIKDDPAYYLPIPSPPQTEQP